MLRVDRWNEPVGINASPFDNAGLGWGSMQQITGSGQPGTRPANAGKHVEDFFYVLGVLRRGWRFVAFAIMICLVIVGVHLVRARTEYRATAQLLVMQKGARPLAAGAGDPLQVQMMGDWIATHLMILQSPAVIGRALESPSLRGVSSQAIFRGLTVKQPSEKANIVEISFGAETGDQARNVLEAIIKSYRNFLKENYQQNANEVVSYIVEARDKLGQELRDLEQQYLDYQRRNPSYTDGTGRPLASQRLELWAQTANQAMARAMQLKTQLELGQQLASEGAGLGALTNALNQLAGVSGGESVTFQPSIPGQAGPSGSTLTQAMTELEAIEGRRRMADLILENLRRQADSSSQAADEAQIVRLFYQEPEVIALQESIHEIQTRRDYAAKLARTPTSDPAARRYDDVLKGLNHQLDELWRAKRPLIVASLQGGSESRQQAEANARALAAQEEALRVRVAELRKEEIDGLRQEQRRLTELHGAADPKVLAIGERIADLERGRVDKSMAAESLIDSLAMSLKAIEAMQGEIQDRFEKDLVASQEAQTRLLEGENLRKNLERQRALFDSVTAQLKQAQIGSDYGSITAEVIMPPTALPVQPKTAFILAFALFAGCALGGGAAFVADMLDPRVRTVTEARAIFNTPLIAVIPQLTPDPTEGDHLEVLCHQWPHSVLTEFYRSARTNLEFLRRNHGAQVLMVSSSRPGDGKTTTVSNLAISLAHAGRRVLLIDGDLRKSSLHATYGLDRDRGLTRILGEGLRPLEGIQRTAITNLDLITAGPPVPNPSEQLASGRLLELINEVRPLYDVVLIDTSPLLAVTDPSVISASVDAMLLVVRVETARRQDAERTTELLRTLGAPVLGVVVNRVSRHQVGYGYGYGRPYGSIGGAEGLGSPRLVAGDDSSSAETGLVADRDDEPPTQPRELES